ncbi:MAG: hypothetical protein NTV07_01115 [Candidatus Omnitrophica bacterium]|nr:hypothetical protein [Candidatus Omnitrophota bacterium]
MTRFKESGAAGWTDINDLEDLLRHDMLPTNDYKFSVSSPVGGISMTGNASDFGSIKPVLFDEEDSEKPEWADLTETYVARDANNLYLGIKFKGGPYSTTLVSGEYLSYYIYFNAAQQDCDWYNAPVVLELHGYYNGGETWEWRRGSRGSDPTPFTTTCTFAKADIMEIRIPLSELRGWINAYQLADFPSGWDNKELFLRVSFSSNISNEQQHESIGGECLASGLD